MVRFALYTYIGSKCRNLNGGGSKNVNLHEGYCLFIPRGEGLNLIRYLPIPERNRVGAL